MEHETGRAVLPGLAQILGAGALVAFGTGYWYLAIPCVAVVVLCVLQLRRWTHRELEEHARLAEEPTEEEAASAAAFEAEHARALGHADPSEEAPERARAEGSPDGAPADGSDDDPTDGMRTRPIDGS